MSSTDPVSSITNCYRLTVSYCPILTQYTASSSRNAQLSQLDLVHLSVVTFDKSGTCLGSSFDNIGRAERAGLVMVTSIAPSLPLLQRRWCLATSTSPP